MIILIMLLVFAPDVRAQCEKPFFENRILADVTDQQIFPNGTSVKFKCSSGYVPLQGSASRSIICNGSQWSELQLQCQKRSCGSPGEIFNGNYMYQPTDGVLFGAVITAVCNEGYQLFGPSTRHCRQNGWDNRPPVCETLMCKTPLDITNGTFEPKKESYEYGEAITFSCRRGLHLFGQRILSCSSTGTFQPALPQCLWVSCKKPEIQHAHKIKGKSPPYDYRHFVRYECDTGYKMKGSGLLTCTEKGWDPAPPQCDIITCTKPPDLINGLYYPSKEVYEYTEKVTYSCINGFNLNRASSSSCTLDGTFEPLLSQCLEIVCHLSVIPGGFVNARKEIYKYNETVQIKCNEGYKLGKSDILTCKEHGWSPSVLRCIEITCDEPNIFGAFIAKGKASSYKDKSSIQIQCYPGNKIVEGSGFLSCGENGWNSTFPKCSPVTCLSPPGINNGQFKDPKSVYEYKESVTYSCDKGYKLHGALTISCTEQGRFQDPPQCLEKHCDNPNIINGFITEAELPSYKYKSSIRVQCNSGYSITGSDYLTCEENGWNLPPPSCRPDYWIWIVLSVILSTALLSGGVVYACCYLKKNQSVEFIAPKKKSDIFKPDHCTLLNEPFGAFPGEEILLKTAK